MEWSGLGPLTIHGSSGAGHLPLSNFGVPVGLAGWHSRECRSTPSRPQESLMDDLNQSEFFVELRCDRLDPTRQVLRLYRREPESVRAPVRRRWGWVLRTGVALGAFSLLAVTPAAAMTAIYPESMLYGVLTACVLGMALIGVCGVVLGGTRLDWVDRWHPVRPAPLKTAAAAVVDVVPEPDDVRLVPSDRVPGLVAACEKAKRLDTERVERSLREHEAKRQREIERLAGQAPTPRS